MYLDIIKNPIFLGVVAGVITYMYLLWNNNNSNSNNNSNDKKKNSKVKNISLITPTIVAVVVAVIAYGYFCNSCEIQQNISPLSQLPPSQFAPTTQMQMQPAMQMQPTSVIVPSKIQSIVPSQIEPGIQTIKPAIGGTSYHFAKDLSSESPATFHLISRGVNIPNNLNVPDVFIETY